MAKFNDLRKNRGTEHGRIFSKYSKQASQTKLTFFPKYQSQQIVEFEIVHELHETYSYCYIDQSGKIVSTFTKIFSTLPLIWLVWFLPGCFVENNFLRHTRVREDMARKIIVCRSIFPHGTNKHIGTTLSDNICNF